MEKVLTNTDVLELGLDKLEVITSDMLEGYTSIEDEAFWNCTSLTTITIPNSVTSIGEGAFVYCSSLTSLTLPNSVTSIGGSAFGYCSSLTSITLPNSVTSIGYGAFSFCSSLTSITLPNSVTSIGDWAFLDCSSLTSITLPNSVTSIGEYAFSGCSALTSIILPNSVTRIGNDAFGGCTSLPVEDNLRYADTYLVEAVDKSLSTYTIKAGTKWIGSDAFRGCSSLTSITIGNSVTSIGNYAFYGCSFLTSLTIPNSVTSIGECAFYNVPNIVYNGTATGSPWGARSVNGYVEGYLVYADEKKTTLLACSAAATGEVTIPNSVTSIEDYAFGGCYSLTSITIPNSVTSIGECAFNRCNNLKNIVIENKTYESQKVVNGKRKAYKAFRGDMTCRDFQYEEGKTYEIEGEPELCKQGFHACLKLLDVFNYYCGEFGKDIVVHEVELEGVSEERLANDSKVVAKKITIGKRIL